MLKFQYDTTLNSQPSPQMSREEENSLNQRIYWRAEHAKISERVRILKSKLPYFTKAHVKTKAEKVLKTYRYFSYLSYLAVLYWSK